MKTDIAGAVIVFFIALFAYTKWIGPIPFSVNSITTSKSDAFSVTGEGKASVSPDIAVVNAGVTAQGQTVKQAQSQLNDSINKVSAAIKKVGVADRDIQTTNYNVSPTYDFRSGSQRVTGYTANSNLTIKVRNVDKVNEVIDAATANGATQVGGVSFDVDDKTKAENEAREKAVADAKKKATDAAKIAGFTLGRIVNYSEDFGGAPRPIPMMAKAEGSDQVMPPTQVEPGSTEVTVTVTLSYEIR